MNNHAKLNVALLLARVPLGLYFLIAGYTHIQSGLGAFVGGGMTHLPAWIPPDLGRAYLYALPFVEFGVGLFVMVGLLTRLSALIKALILVSILLAMGGIDPGKPFHPNIILLGVALLLALLGGGEISIDRIMQRRKNSKPQPA
jgi:thiosulfate dehydrogenase [quinone] large subunit